MEKLEQILEQHSDVWKTKSAFMSWMRGGIRRSLWNRHPVKLEFIKQNRIKIPNPNPKGKVKEVWGGVCSITGETHVIAELDVDHLRGNHSLIDVKDIQNFIESIVLVTLEDLQFVSKEAHKLKTYAERYNVDFDTARAEKEAKQLVDKKLDKEYCIEHNLVVESTQALRRKTIVAHKLRLLKEKDSACI